MGVNGIEGTAGSNEGGYRDLAAKRHQEASFEQMLDIDIARPRHEPPMQPAPMDMPADDRNMEGLTRGPHEHHDHSSGRPGVDHAADLRQQAVELRQEAAELRQQAQEVSETGEGAHMRQVYVNRAEALEQRAEAREKEADTVDARAADRAEDRRLNGGDSEPVEDVVTPRDPDVAPVEGWGSAELVTAYGAELQAIEGFEGADVTATREATENEVDAFLDQADEMGLQDLEFAEGYLQAFPIQFVYVDNLEDYGMETATNGELYFDNKSIILVDTEFASADTTTDLSPQGDAARDAVEFSYSAIIEVMLEMETVEMATAPNPVLMDTLDESSNEEESSTSAAAAASAPVSALSDADADE